MPAGCLRGRVVVVVVGEDTPAGELGGCLVDSEPCAAGSNLVQPVPVLGVKLGVAALGPDGLAVDEEGEHGRRRLEQVARGHDQVGPLAGFERPDLVGDSEDLRRRDRDGLEATSSGRPNATAVAASKGRLRAAVSPSPELPAWEWMATSRRRRAASRGWHRRRRTGRTHAAAG